MASVLMNYFSENTTDFPEGNAIVYCQGAFRSTYCNTAYGLVRHTKRYNVLSVIDINHVGQDACAILDGRPRGIPVVADIKQAGDGCQHEEGSANHETNR